MSSTKRRSRASTLSIAARIALLGTFVALSPASALRLVNYNLLNYPGSTGSARAEHFRTILAPLHPDLVVVQEMTGDGSAGSAQFLNEVLNVLEPGQWAAASFINGNDTDAALFYKPAVVDLLGHSAFYPNPADPLRLIHVFRIRPDGYAAPEAALHLYVAHLKASQGFESQRLAECVGIRDSMNVMPEGTRAMLCGDLNFYSAVTETGYAKLLEDQIDDTGRLLDIIPAGAWHDNPTFAGHHTQSPCLSGTCASGAATGGMDDRFDFLLPTYNLMTGQGLAVIPASYVVVGNDGLHLNKNITDSPVIPEGTAYANALKLASDHLPVRLDIQVPAMYAGAPSLDFGRVIIGAPAQVVDLTITNPAASPADGLDCGFAASDGFSGPSPITVPAGEASAVPITMAVDTVGEKSGTLVVATDAPDTPLTNVQLGGAVLAHAAASLDSVATVLAGSIDFGDHEAGAFQDETVRLHNASYDLHHAALVVHTGTIVGGEGRFSFPDGFDPCVLREIGRSYALRFDPAGAAMDSTYTATLVFTSADEPLPGALPQPDVVLTLRARVSGELAYVQPTATPDMTRIVDATPNPFSGRTTIRVAIARDLVHARISVFDPAGRCVATLHDGFMAAGFTSFRWDGAAPAGSPLASGIYFIRLDAPGAVRQTTRLAVLR